MYWCTHFLKTCPNPPESGHHHFPSTLVVVACSSDVTSVIHRSSLPQSPASSQKLNVTLYQNLRNALHEIRNSRTENKKTTQITFFLGGGGGNDLCICFRNDLYFSMTSSPTTHSHFYYLYHPLPLQQSVTIPEICSLRCCTGGLTLLRSRFRQSKSLTWCPSTKCVASLTSLYIMYPFGSRASRIGNTVCIQTNHHFKWLHYAAITKICNHCTQPITVLHTAPCGNIYHSQKVLHRKNQ